MIVVAIIGILAALAIPKFADLIRKSNEGVTKGNLGAIRSALAVYYGEQEGFFPQPTADGQGAGSLEGILTSNSGKYMKTMPKCFVPPYHTAYYGDTTISVASATESSYPGGWGYEEDPNAATYGSVWVNCTHTDSKTTTWGIY
jgi:type II secretory pathway pseudopilin PulG